MTKPTIGATAPGVDHAIRCQRCRVDTTTCNRNDIAVIKSLNSSWKRNVTVFSFFVRPFLVAQFAFVPTSPSVQTTVTRNGSRVSMKFSFATRNHEERGFVRVWYECWEASWL
eukprot:TRINITY_DN5075_c0_g1_i11.p2 TRINITY_DN5075_c0_g1~~TRINITY_DN5075_c0_g1_i11.p2  ORF type:complete len:113 (+),score=4.60 TRINITY_DN5075_c0_g1_i11:124-462(+)